MTYAGVVVLWLRRASFIGAVCLMVGPLLALAWISLLGVDSLVYSGRFTYTFSNYWALFARLSVLDIDTLVYSYRDA